MSETAHGAAEVARLILAHPDLPVLKLGGGYEDDDNFVLALCGAHVGQWIAYDLRIWDDLDDCAEAILEDNEGMSEAEAMDAAKGQPHGDCIWVSMDYFDVEVSHG